MTILNAHTKKSLETYRMQLLCLSYFSLTKYLVLINSYFKPYNYEYIIIIW